jgi:hypothetical protein
MFLRGIADAHKLFIDNGSSAGRHKHFAIAEQILKSKLHQLAVSAQRCGFLVLD